MFVFKKTKIVINGKTIYEKSDEAKKIESAFDESFKKFDQAMDKFDNAMSEFDKAMKVFDKL